MTKLKTKLYDNFKLQQLGVDFMGYEFENKKELTYHHILPKNLGGKTTFENGALLIRDSHNYIHLVEVMDFKLFIELSQELKKEHETGEITKERLIAIQQMLEFFENKYKNSYARNGTPLIKSDFVRRRIDFSGKS